jgi:hypothetical protein
MGQRKVRIRTAIVSATVLAAGLLTATALPAMFASAAATRYEAETATLSQGVVESNHPGFSGTGFANYHNVAGSAVQWSVNATAAGTATLAFRFANGTTTPRPMDIAVNGSVVASGVTFPGTGSWSNWQTKSITAPVVPGANAVKATATSADGGPNVDWLEVEVAAPSSEFQAEDATITQGVVESNHVGFTGTGFVNYNNVVGSAVEWTVGAPSAGSAGLSFRYANGTTTNRAMDISVNGTTVRSGLAFGGTGNWATWKTVTINVALKAGNNTVKATATTTNGGPNVDKLSVGVVGDTQRPSSPGQPTCSNLAETSLTLSWAAASDNVGVVAYDIFHDGTQIDS